MAARRDALADHWRVLARVTRDDLKTGAGQAPVLGALAAVAPLVGDERVLRRLVALVADASPDVASALATLAYKRVIGAAKNAREGDDSAAKSTRILVAAAWRGAGKDAARAFQLLAALLAGKAVDASWGAGLRAAVALHGGQSFREMATAVLAGDRTLEGTASLLIEERLVGSGGAFATSAEVVRALGQVAQSESRTGDPHARRALQLVRAIGCAPPALAFPELERLRLRVRHGSVKKAVEKALEQVAVALGARREDLEDSSVPTFGLDANGVLVLEVEGLRLELGAAGKVSWASLAGAPPTPGPESTSRTPSKSKTRPSPELRKLQRAIESALVTQRTRLEDAMVSGRSWSLGSWRKSFARHPLLANLARRVLWSVSDSREKTAVLLHQDRLETLAGVALEPSDDARIAIAHPIDLEPATLEAARAVWVARGLVQPWKQLFRETYTPLASELASHACDRFRNHVVPYPSLHALARGRGWRGFGPFPAAITRAFASGETAVLDLDPATSFVPPGADSMDPLPTIRLGTLGFSRKTGGQMTWLELDELPPVVFSETVRDLDLVVGVASLGEDSDWAERLLARAVFTGDVTIHAAPPDPGFAATAQMRAAVLERILPSLGLGSRVRLDGRHARVQGELNAYRIHLGTGHTYIEPEGRFVVFPPASRRDALEVYLPEDTATDPQAREVVSRILTLAADHLVADPELARQLNSRAGDV